MQRLLYKIGSVFCIVFFQSKPFYICINLVDGTNSNFVEHLHTSNKINSTANRNTWGYQRYQFLVTLLHQQKKITSTPTCSLILLNSKCLYTCGLCNSMSINMMIKSCSIYLSANWLHLSCKKYESWNKYYKASQLTHVVSLILSLLY